jgi:hypothetical protein
LMEMGKVDVGKTLEVMHLPRQSRFRRAWPTWFQPMAVDELMRTYIIQGAMVSYDPRKN